MSIEKIRDKIRGSLIGGAIGDALGYEIEFDRGANRRKIDGFSGKNGFGKISDDTQMTMFVANALLYRETRFAIRGMALVPTEAAYLGLLDWLGTQERVKNRGNITFLTQIPELNVVREPGRTCLEALESGKMGKIWEPINDSKGAGGIMRLAPVGLYLHPNFYGKSVGENGAEIAAITHGHPLVILSGYVMTEMIWLILNEDFSIEKAAREAISRVKKWKYYDPKKDKDVEIFSKEKVEIVGILERAIEMGKRPKEEISDEEAINSLGEGWVAEEALAIAIFCAIRYENDFRSGVLAAVNHDGDSDTTGAILGNILGARVGYEAIPEEFRENIELSQVILEIADDMTNGVPTDENGGVSDEKWLKKYLQKIPSFGGILDHESIR